MEFGLFGVGDHAADPITGVRISEQERLRGMARVAVHAEQAGFDVYALGEHHNPPFVASAPSTVLAYIAAQTERITLSTSVTLITTNDPVRIAEDYTTLQNLAGDRVDIVLGRGNTPEVYPWFGRDVRDGIPLAVENYELLRRLWDEEVVTWSGRFRTPLEGYTATPRPLNGRPPFVWHGNIRSPEIAEQASRYGDGFFANNLFMTMDYFARYIDFYRERYAAHGHGRPEDAIVGAGGAVFLRERSQDAVRDYEPFYRSNSILSTDTLENLNAHTGMTVGSPAQVVEKVLTSREKFGDYRRQLFGMDFAGVGEARVHEMIDLMGEQVLPVLHRELGSSSTGASRPSPASRSRTPRSCSPSSGRV